MKYLGIKPLVFIILSLPGFFSCQKEDNRENIPIVSFERTLFAVDVDNSTTFNLRVGFSNPAHKDFILRFNLSGSATQGIHYAVTSTEVAVSKGTSEIIIPFSINSENIWASELTIKVLLIPSVDYAIDPQLAAHATIVLSKEISLPFVSFLNTDNIFTNPFNAETITLGLAVSEPLQQDAQVVLQIHSEMIIGEDFLINGSTSPIIDLPMGKAEFEFEIQIIHKDEGGFDKLLQLTLAAAEPPTVIPLTEGSQVVIEVGDPIVDLSPMFITVAQLGGVGHQIRQAIRAADQSWSGNVIIDASANPNKPNHMRSHRNMSFNALFNCLANTAGGDLFRLSNLLFFASDTTIADYGTGSTTRFFSPTQSFLRFVANGKDITRGNVSSPRQKFKANLILRSNWESGSNPNRPWQIDSRLTNGIIENSTVPTFHTMEVWLEKLEGTFDFTLPLPEIIFTAWFQSDSPYFLRTNPQGLDIVKEGDWYKVTYRFYPRT
jgi:hypothetical protein